MNYSNLLQHIETRINEHRVSISRAVLRGGIAPEEYSRLTGNLQAFDVASGILADINKRLTQEDEAA